MTNAPTWAEQVEGIDGTVSKILQTQWMNRNVTPCEPRKEKFLLAFSRTRQHDWQDITSSLNTFTHMMASRCKRCSYVQLEGYGY